ncbi:extracellular solute-binding protein [Paenibacillus ginsengarvi]|uniref:Extracellular solute-binding protein n=2 Tax=Paenibacillus ginsengarvi TaxID=400777 RepID=A0A3B0BRK6_9BACL|nr:extracellular solute-binding protein [Paenibacillus ginsengarvi]
MKKLIVTSALVFASSLAAGCTAWTDKPTSTVPGAKEITLVTMDSNTKNRISSFEKSAKLFEDANPGVKVHVEKLATPKGYRTALLERAKDNKPIDLIYANHDTIQIEQNTFADLVPMFKSDKMTTDDLYEKLVEMSTVKGKLIGIPLNPLPLAVFYNKEWFDKAGMPYPDKEWTWDQFFNQSIKLQAANRVEGKEIFGSVVPLDLHLVESLARSSGQSIIATDGNRFSGYLNSKPVVSAITKLLFHMNTSKASKAVSSTTAPVFNELRAFNIGMGIGAANMFYPLEATSQTAGKFGFAPLPFLEKGAKANAVYYNLLTIAEGSKQKELAWKFMKDVILNPDSQFQKDWGQQDMLTVKSAVPKSGQLTFKGMDVLIEELNYAVMPLSYRNTLLNSIKVSDQSLLTATTEAEVMASLSSLAEEIDKKLIDKK